VLVIELHTDAATTPVLERHTWHPLALRHL
jgi:hypothetical protein